jgi:tetratricopeptide (TPR) repeat protein
MPGAPVPPASRGALYFIAGRPEEAVAALQKSLELEREAMDFQARRVLAFVYADQKKFSLAESTLQECGRLSKDPRKLFFEGHLEEARGRPEAARDLYRKAVVEEVRANRNERAGQALMALARISQVLGESATALVFARQQRLEGAEHLAISFLVAVEGDMAGAERSLRNYAAACPWLTPAGIQIFRARNQMAAALQRNDGLAARASASRYPILPEPWMLFDAARAALLVKDYGSVEHLLRRTQFVHRWLLATIQRGHIRSPLVVLLCHFYLAQVHEATSKREQAVNEYRRFLSPFEASATRLPQITEARAALKRLGAQ